MPDGAVAGYRDLAKMPADGRCVNGIGCLAQPAILIDRLHRLLARYEEPAKSMAAAPDDGSSFSRAARPLIRRLSDQMLATDGRTSESRSPVVGFFLQWDGGRVWICALTRQGGSRPSRRS
jgi:hypothetical protein